MSSLPPNFRTFENEYKELYESYLVAARYLDGEKMPRELKNRINVALDKAAIRFNADALKALKATKGV